MSKFPTLAEQDWYPSNESLESGVYDSALAKRFALEYVKTYGDPIKAYMRVFGVTKQAAHPKIDAWMNTECVRIALRTVTAPTETIASAGEVLAAITNELRGAEEPKDRLKAAELLLKVRGHMDREKRKNTANQAPMMLVAMVKQYANKSPAQLEAELIGGGHALRDSNRDGGEIQDAEGSGEVDVVGEGDLLVEPGSVGQDGGFAEGSPAQDESEEKVMQ